MLGRRLIQCVLVLGCLCSALGSAYAAGVLIVSSERSAGYVEAANTIATELERGGLMRSDISQWVIGEPALVEEATAGPVRLVITLGADALSYAIRRDWRVPVLAALIPRSGYERTLKETGGKSPQLISAMYLDQPFGRQLDLLRLALPDAKKVGVLWGPQSIAQQSLLMPSLQQRAMTLVSSSTAVEGSLFGALRVVLDEADVLLAVADPQVYSSATISGILLSTYRARTPLMAFSPAYVKAGALLALHTTPAQVGAQVATMARSALQGGGLPTPQYPVDYQVSVNEHVARSLGLTLDARTLEDRLRRLEKKP